MPRPAQKLKPLPPPTPAPDFYRMPVAKWIKSAFIGPGPSVNTIKSAITRGEYRGEQIGNLWFIHVDGGLNPLQGQPGQPGHPPSTSASTGNADADALLAQWQTGR